MRYHYHPSHFFPLMMNIYICSLWICLRKLLHTNILHVCCAPDDIGPSNAKIRKSESLITEVRRQDNSIDDNNNNLLTNYTTIVITVIAITVNILPIVMMITMNTMETTELMMQVKPLQQQQSLMIIVIININNTCHNQSHREQKLVQTNRQKDGWSELGKSIRRPSSISTPHF